MSPSKSKTSLHKFAIGGTESENDSEVGKEKEKVETGQNIAKDTIEDNKVRKNSSNEDEEEDDGSYRAARKRRLKQFASKFTDYEEEDSEAMKQVIN